jgi:hypothetical protein
MTGRNAQQNRQSGQLQLLLHDFSPLREPKSEPSGLKLILMLAIVASKAHTSQGGMQGARQLFET